MGVNLFPLPVPIVKIKWVHHWASRNSRTYAYLAQLVEQETLNFEVGGSNPSMGTRVAPHGEVNTQLL